VLLVFRRSPRSAQEAGNTEPKHEHGAEARHEKTHQIVGSGFARFPRKIQVKVYRLEPKNHGKAHEKKADDLIPQSARRFQDGGYHVPYEFAATARV
jgi:hypothetical protein